jgi:splicing factor 3B subunit 3
VPEGIVSVAEDMLRIFSLDRLGEAFNQTSVALRYTPRKMLVDVRQRALVVVETDHNAYSVDELRAIHKELNGDVKNEPKDDMMTDSEAPHESPEELAAREAQEAFTGPMQGGAGKWASCIRIVDPLSASSVYALELTDNEAAFSAELCSFASNGEEIFLAVGTAKDLVLSPRSMSAAFIHIYRFVFGADGSRSLELIHKTEVDGVPMSLHAFQGQLLAGCGRHVRLFDMGKKKLLRKAELRAFPSGVQSLHSMGDRIYGGDLSDAFQFIKYRRSDRSLYTFAENSVPHFMTATCVVDYDTMAGGDKFGNIVVSRLPDDFAAGSEDVEDTSAASVSATVFNADTNKLIDICNFYVGETVTSIVKTGLMQGGVEVLLYSTIYGTIGALVPFADKADVEFFTSLEMHMRLHSPSLVGREHASFRSYYFPVKVRFVASHVSQNVS